MYSTYLCILTTPTDHAPWPSHSPQIQAASAKLTELKSKPQTSSGSGTNSPAPSFPPPMPSGNDDVLSAQRQRFDDLKVGGA